MRVCAHMNLGPYQNVHRQVDTIKQAVDYFRRELERFYGSLDGILDRTGEDNAPGVDIYEQCDACNSQMNFHDYPSARWQVGPRGGIRKVCV